MFDVFHLKGFAQDESFACGPAVFRTSLFNLKGIEISEQEAIKVCQCTPNNGTHPKDFEAAFKEYNINDVFSETNSSLQKVNDYLKKGYLCIVEWTSETSWLKKRLDSSLPKEEGHYSIIIAVNDKNVTLYDPDYHSDKPKSKGFRKISRTKFEKKWFDSETEDGKEVEYRKYVLGVRV